MIITPTVIDVESSDLTGDEQETARELSQRLERVRPFLQVKEWYYDGEQRIRQLGIAIPEQLQALHTAVGWPRMTVDVLDERLEVEGFRLPDSDDSDDHLWDLWQMNCMDTESPLAHLDALTYGCAFGMVGTNPDGSVSISVESPGNMVATFDAFTRKVTAALQMYWFAGKESAALYLPDVTVHLERDSETSWSERERDEHNLGFCPVVMLTNRPRTADRYGVSEITPELESITDAACRTLLGMEVSREFFGAPQRYILGASEDAFVDAQGRPKPAWETYIGRILAFERDEEGNVPQVGTFSANDPTAYVNILTMYSRIVAGLTGLPPHLLGFTSDNPASAEGIRAAEARLDKRAIRKQRGFGGGWRDLMQMVMAIENGGVVPESAKKLQVMWTDPRTPTPAETTQAGLNMVQAGYMPPASDVFGAYLGFSAAERRRIARERDEQNANDKLDQIAAAMKSPRFRYASHIRGQGGNAAEGINAEGGDVPLPKGGAAGGNGDPAQ